MDKILTACFLGGNQRNRYNIKSYISDTIRYLIIKRNISHFIFGCGSEFENTCFETVKSFKAIYGVLTYEIYRCKNIEDFKNIIDMSDYCIFEDSISDSITNIWEGAENFSTSETLKYLLNYSIEKNKTIFYI